MQKSNSGPLWPIISITLFATILRLTGYNWGLPFVFHPDEARILDGAWKAYWGFDAWESDYGMLPMRAIALIWKIRGLLDRSFAEAPTGPEHFVAAMSMARVLAGGFGIATVILLYFKSIRHFDWKIGVLSAAILTLSPIHIQLSHFITVDIFMVFFVSLTFFGLLEYSDAPARLSASLLGIWLGLMLSCKLSSLPLVPIATLIVAAAGILAPHPKNRYLWAGIDLLLMLGICAGIYIFIQPEAMSPSRYFWLDPTDPFWWNAFNLPQGTHKFEWNALMSRGVVKPLWTLANRLGPIDIAANLLWGMGIASFASLGGIFFLRRSMTKRKFLIIILCIAPLAASFLQSHVFFLRYASPILPFAAIIAAAFIANPDLPMARFRRWFAAIAGVLSVFHASAAASIYWQEDSRFVAGRWLSEHLPTGSKICVEEEAFTTPIMDVKRFEVAVMPIYKWDLSMRIQISKDSFQLAMNGDRYTEIPEIWSHEFSLSQIISVISECEYFVLSDRLWDQIFKTEATHPLRMLYENLHDPSRGFEQLAHIQVRPQVFGIRLDDAWTEPTVRLFDHPQFRVIQKRSGATPF
jgi:hypothetical protein